MSKRADSKKMYATIEKVLHDGMDNGVYSASGFKQFITSIKGDVVTSGFIFPNTQNVYHCDRITLRHDVNHTERKAKVTAFGSERNIGEFERILLKESKSH